MIHTQDDTLEGIIKDVFSEETTFFLSYPGQVVVNIDPLGKGRIACIVPNLGWDTPDVAAWCSSRQINSISTPSIGAWVNVKFLMGDMNKPYYDGVIQDMGTPPKFGLPTLWLNLPTHHVLFESPIQGLHILADDILGLLAFGGAKILTLDSTLITMNKGIEPFVKGLSLSTLLVSLQTQINAMVTAFNAHMHPTAALGPPSPPTIPQSPVSVDPATTLSTGIFGK